MTNWIPPVPTADSSDNNTMNDVIGNKNDTHLGDSIRALIHILDEHIHKSSKMYPTLANGEPVVSGAAWVLGVFKEIIPINTITDPFDVHYVSIENLTANDTYELVLYDGADAEIGRCRFVKNAVQDGTVNVPIQTPIQPANTQIKAKLATSSGGDTATISLFYHTY